MIKHCKNLLHLICGCLQVLKSFIYCVVDFLGGTFSAAFPRLWLGLQLRLMEVTARVQNDAHCILFLTSHSTGQATSPFFCIVFLLSCVCSRSLPVFFGIFISVIGALGQDEPLLSVS